MRCSLEIRARNLIIWSSVFVVTFLISLVLFLTSADRKGRYVLFFPSEITNEWIGEARNIFHTRNTEEAVRALLNELALGPIGLRLGPAVPKETGIRSVLIRGKTAYIDFTAHLAVGQRVPQVSFYDMLEGIERSVLYNFQSIEEVFIHVEGSSTGRL